MKQMTNQEYQDQEYAPPVNYFDPSPSETKALEKEANTLRAEIDNKGTSWVNRTRASSRLGEVDRLIKSGRDAVAKQVSHTSSEDTLQRVRKAAAAVKKSREAAGLKTLHPTDVPRSPFRANNSEGRWVESDQSKHGDPNAGWLWIKWSAAEKVANLAAAVGPKVEEQMYAACGQ